MRFSCPHPCRRKTPVRSVPRPAHSWSHRSREDAAGSTSSSPIQRRMPKASRSESGCSVRKVNMTISLAFLAPDLVKAAIEGTTAHGMGVVRLCRSARRMVAPAPDARPYRAVTRHSNRSLPPTVSVAGKRDFEARDKRAKTASRATDRRLRDRSARTKTPPIAAPFATACRKSPQTARLRGGPGRTRTSNQTVMSGRL